MRMRNAVGLTVWLTCFAVIGGVGRAATDPVARCKDTKARAAGKKAADLMTAFGRNFKLSDPARLAFSVSKAQSKLTKQFAKAEAKGGCATSGDAAAIEAKVDMLVSDVAADVSGITTTTTTMTTTTTTTTFPLACDCCAVADQLSFTATTPSGICGTLANFRCSGNGNASCGTDADCNEGPCGATVPGFCGDLSPLIECTSDADCSTGTCEERVAPSLPLDLECGGLYVGGGDTALPMPVWFSDTMTLVTDVTGCNGATGALTLGPATSVETGSTLTCTAMGCRFGAPIPLALPPPGAYSLCAVASLAQDAGGSGTCNGAMRVDLTLSTDLYRGDDLLAGVPADVAGVQPCPLCVRQCGGGTNDRTPCADDGDCTGGGTCGAETECLGGANDAEACTPATTDLGDAFPTSHDCLPTAGSLETQVTLDVRLTTSALAVSGRDLGAGTGAQRVFAGFCRDSLDGGSLCFEGSGAGGCPAGGASEPVPCQTDADCDDADTYESCAQRTSGAFGLAAATRMTLDASAPAQCLADGFPRPATLAGAFGFPPTFDSLNDANYNLPGPGTVTIEGDVALVP